MPSRLSITRAWWFTWHAFTPDRLHCKHLIGLVWDARCNVGSDLESSVRRTSCCLRPLTPVCLASVRGPIWRVKEVSPSRSSIISWRLRYVIPQIWKKGYRAGLQTNQSQAEGNAATQLTTTGRHVHSQKFNVKPNLTESNVDKVIKTWSLVWTLRCGNIWMRSDEVNLQTSFVRASLFNYRQTASRLIISSAFTAGLLSLQLEETHLLHWPEGERLLEISSLAHAFSWALTSTAAASLCGSMNSSFVVPWFAQGEEWTVERSKILSTCLHCSPACVCLLIITLTF